MLKPDSETFYLEQSKTVELKSKVWGPQILMLGLVLEVECPYISPNVSYKYLLKNDINILIIKSVAAVPDIGTWHVSESGVQYWTVRYKTFSFLATNAWRGTHPSPERLAWGDYQLLSPNPPSSTTRSIIMGIAEKVREIGQSSVVSLTRIKTNGRLQFAELEMARTQKNKVSLRPCSSHKRKSLHQSYSSWSAFSWFIRMLPTT